MAPPDARDDTVLILSTDAVTAALLSLLAELDGFHPVYAERDEAPERSVTRLKPRFLLIDCDHVAACTDEIFRLARSNEVQVIVFSPGRMRDDVRTFAESRSLPWFSLPVERGMLSRIIRRATLALLPLAVFGLTL